MASVETQQRDLQSDSAPQSSLDRAHAASEEWAAKSVRQRLAIIKKFRHAMVEEAVTLAELIELPQRKLMVESLGGEVIPVADACRFLERNATSLLAPRRTSNSDRPAWGPGLETTVLREPVGIVLIIGTWNYPLLLTGTQILQALVAGNAVMVKPGQGTTKLTNHFASMLHCCGVPEDALIVLPEDPTEAMQAMDEGVGKVVFTGSAATGKRVLAQLAETATPAVMELSGSDAMFVLPDADLNLVARCIEFGLRMNGSSTCIAPRRVFVPANKLEGLKSQLLKVIADLEPTPVFPPAGVFAAETVSEALDSGAKLVSPNEWNGYDDAHFPATVLEFEHDPEIFDRVKLLRSDVFAPVVSLIPVTDMEQALRFDALCSYALGATVYGSLREAQSLARKIDAGCVVINDMIAPTADARVPFGGRNGSGFGMTRGAEGLLEMTQVKAIVAQKYRFLPHLDRPIPELGDLLLDFLRFNHGATWSERWKAMLGMSKSGRAYWNATRRNKKQN